MKRNLIRKVIVWLCMVSAFNIYGQDLLQKLVGKSWYVEGRIFENNQPLRFERWAPDLSYMTRATLFSDSLIVFNFMKEADSTDSGKGINMDFACSYKLKKDVMKISYIINTPQEAIKKRELTFYYVVKESSATSFEFLPATAADFK